MAWIADAMAMLGSIALSLMGDARQRDSIANSHTLSIVMSGPLSQSSLDQQARASPWPWSLAMKQRKLALNHE